MSGFDPNYVHVNVFFIVGGKAIVLNSDNKILVMKRATETNGKWGLPGGALNEGEEPVVGIRREILEEAQITVSEPKPYHVKLNKTGSGHSAIVIGYVCKTESESVILSREHTEYKWVTREEGLELDLTVDGRVFLEKYTG